MKDETGKSSSDAGETIHFSAYWNPTVEFDPSAPKGMKLWANVLYQFRDSPRQRYTLYGKVSETGRLGIGVEEIPTLNTRVQDQKDNKQETYIYLFNTARIKEHPYIPESLHVGRVEAVLNEADVMKLPRDRIPTHFYDSVTSQGHKAPFWFMLSDLREIPISEFDNLEAYYPEEHQWRPFNKENDLSPLKVREKKPQGWFRTAIPKPHKAWYDLEVLSSVSGKREPLEPGLFRSPVIREVYAKALKYATLGEPILILGERGTGKTVLAGFIRNNHLRLVKNKVAELIPPQWPNVACGEFMKGDALLKSQLFGWKKGAFTGADEDHDGLLKQAHNDCILFDEIHDLDRTVQRLLIKAVAEKRFLPVGAKDYEESDFLLITASNRKIEEIQSQLDADFLDRILYAELKLPPLRDLGADMLLLWRYEYEKATSRIKGRNAIPTGLSPDQEEALVDALTKHGLPGNFRDLTRVAMRVVEVFDDSKATFSPEQVIQEALGWRTDGAEYLDRKRICPTTVQIPSENETLSSTVTEQPKEDPKSSSDTARMILDSFLHGKDLSDVLRKRVKVDVEGLLEDLRSYLMAAHIDSEVDPQRQRDPVQVFIDERLTRADKGGTLLQVIYDNYKAWANENREKTVSARSLKKEIEEEFGIEGKKTKKGQFLPVIFRC